MNPWLKRTGTLAYAGMALSFAVWAFTRLPPAGAALAALPLLLCAAAAFRRTVRPLVVAGAVALPYLAVIIVEIIASGGRAMWLNAALACGVGFMAVLVPITRQARHAAGLSPRR